MRMHGAARALRLLHGSGSRVGHQHCAQLDQNLLKGETASNSTEGPFWAACCSCLCWGTQLWQKPQPSRKVPRYAAVSHWRDDIQQEIFLSFASSPGVCCRFTAELFQPSDIPSMHRRPRQIQTSCWPQYGVSKRKMGIYKRISTL